MVLKRRLDYESNGYEFPPIPRAARSARRRVPVKTRFQENQMCAFDLLAVVAGKLLLEKDATPDSGNIFPNDESAVNKECKFEEKTLEAKVHDVGSPARSFFVSELVHAVPDENHSHKESLYSEKDLNLELTSATTTSGCKEKFNGDKVVDEEVKSSIGTSSSKVEVGFSENVDDSIDTKVDGKVEHNLHDEPSESGKLAHDTCGGMFSSESTLSAHHIPHCSYPANEDNVNIVSSRDDDENSSGCTHPSTMKRLFRRTPRIGDRRIKKILASRCWKVASRLKDTSFSNRQGDLKPFYHTGKNYYKLDRSERLYPVKKRRRFSYSSPSNSVGMIDTDLAQKGCNGDASANGYRMSSSSAGNQSLFQPRDSQVKLRIKSFRVPELFIEIPETATIGSLKRTVVDAFTALLGGGVCVGVLLQGRKVRDDHKTLLQTGISHSNHLDALGFRLEPNPSHNNRSMCSGDLTSVSCQTPQPLSRYPHTPNAVHQGTKVASCEPQTVNVGNLVESDHDSAPSPTDTLIARSTSDPKALLAAPAMNAAADALAVISANRKSKRAEMAQRRIRRPFSVAEVEALVQAVEKLGTGRWRDVKVRAFDHAKHRTYVDLKDKWKTLVHTARISPQQRRGEPVPQELLDRVLIAHAYWSNQQQPNQQTSDSCTFPSPLIDMP